MTLFGVLTVVFVTFKLMAIIDWSWWAVLSPIFIGFVINALVYMAFVVFVKRF